MNATASAAQAERDKLFPVDIRAELEAEQQLQGRSIEQYAADRGERPNYAILPTPEELAAQEGERDGESSKGDGRGDATHIAASKPLPGDELAATAYGFKEGETPNERALQNAENNQPSHTGAAFAAAAILATEQSNDQQPAPAIETPPQPEAQAERDKLFPSEDRAAIEAEQQQGRSFAEYQANGQNYAALQGEQDAPVPTRPGDDMDKLFPPDIRGEVQQEAASMGRSQTMSYGLG